MEKDGERLGIGSIYASNNHRERTQLWQWMVSYLPEVPWVFGGDFNMVEFPEDKWGGVGNGLEGVRKALLEEIKKKI